MGPDGATGRFALIDAGACVGAEWPGHRADDCAGAKTGAEGSVGRGPSRDVGADARTWAGMLSYAGAEHGGVEARKKRCLSG